MNLEITPDEITVGDLYQDDVLQIFLGPTSRWVAHHHPDWPFSLLALHHPVMRLQHAGGAPVPFPDEFVDD